MIAEKEIWDQFRAGSVPVFERMYALYAKELYSYGRNFTNEGVLVEDCLQELFTDLWEKRENLGDTTSIKFYLLSSLRRRLVRKLQQENRRRVYDENEEIKEAFQSTSSSERLFILNEEETERQALLLKAINSLPVRQREVMHLRYYKGLSFDQITEIMALPKKTAYNIVFKALESIRAKLKLSFELLVLLLWCL